ncbi:hypothetical protein [Lentzea nigeriaca]|uniref:hypothetical protein n=1 Tax=Lentzea nigeriaca TaxID=1128665 RepID=UPI0019587341|nr:hypothetical protein [Lentzea nigeriaca]MBM7863453.1 hypothetical protein [Lentzea nigeriaca]
MVPPGSRKIVLGLLVDRDHVRLNRATRSRIAENVRGVERFDLAQHVANRRFCSIDGFVHHVDGLLAFATNIEPGWAAEAKARWQLALEETTGKTSPFEDPQPALGARAGSKQGAGQRAEHT